MFTPVLSPGRLIDERLSDEQKKLIDGESVRVEAELRKTEGLRLDTEIPVSTELVDSSLHLIVAWRFQQAGWQVKIFSKPTGLNSDCHGHCDYGSKKLVYCFALLPSFQLHSY